ncbi:MAG TPA: NADH-quinone oxidoreductase subunit B, partial [Candidatus Latescibacteria bacterium]|nr:NADH-quinone oxidoreductase subunit B [Candidatus Latescibacterota bacterium]
PFKYPGQYAIIEGADRIIPVDVYVPGCPPRPEALFAGILKLRDKIRFGDKTPATVA